MATYQEMLARQSAPREGGLLSNIISGITSPVRRLFESARYASSAPGAYNPMFESSSAEDINSAIRNPNLNVAKTIGLGASFLTPGTIGSGLKGAVGSGVLGGSLGGFSASESEDLLGSLTDAGKGALVGGVAGGALYGTGKALGGIQSKLGSGKLSSKADDITEDIIRGDVTVSKNRTIGRVNKRATEARKAMEKAGVKVSDVETMALQADEITSKLAQQKQALLKQSNYQMTGDDLLEALGGTKAFRDNPSLIKSKALEPYFEMLNTRAMQKGGAVGADDLYSVIKSIDDELYSISSGQVAPKSNAANRALKAMRDSLSKEVKGVPGVADIDKTIAPIQRWLETDSAYAIRRQSGSQPIVQAAIPGSQMLGVGKLVNKAKATTANALRGIESGAQAGTSGASNLLNTLSGQSGRIGAGLGILQGMGGQLQEEPIMNPQEALGGSVSPLEALGQPDPIQIQAQITLELMNRGVDMKEAAAYAELVVASQYDAGGGSGEPQKLTEKQRAYQEAGQQAQQALSLLEQGGVDTGQISGRIEGLQQALGLGDETNTEYRALIAGARTVIRNALLGANMSPKELESISAFIPEYTDPPQVARVKLQKLIESTQRYSGEAAAPDYSEDILRALGQ